MASPEAKHGSSTGEKSVAFADDPGTEYVMAENPIHPKKLNMFLGSWITKLSQDVSYEVSLEEKYQNALDERYLRGYIKRQYVPRSVVNVKPTSVWIRRVYEEQLAHAIRNGEMDLMKRAKEDRMHLLILWFSTIKMQKAFRRRYQIKMKAATFIQKMYRGFAQRKRYANRPSVIRARKAAENARKRQVQAEWLAERRMAKQQQIWDRHERRQHADVLVAELVAEVCTKKRSSIPRSDTVAREELAEEQLQIATKLLGEWEAAASWRDDPEERDVAATTIQAWARGGAARQRFAVLREIHAERLAVVAEEARLAAIGEFTPKPFYNEREKHAALKLQTFARKHLAKAYVKVLRMERLAANTYSAKGQLPITEKRCSSYARTLTRVVAPDTRELQKFHAVAPRAMKHSMRNADVQLLSPKRPVTARSRGRLFPELRVEIPVDIVPTSPNRPYTAPELTKGKKSFKSKRTQSKDDQRPHTSHGPEMGKGFGDRSRRGGEDLGEDLEPSQEAFDFHKSWENFKIVQQGAKSRLSRCRAMIADIGQKPEEMENELTSELNALLWQRLGAPPVFHVDMDGTAKPDPFAPVGKLFPLLDGSEAAPPAVPDAWRRSVIAKNKNRREEVRSDYRRRKEEWLQELARQEEERRLEEERQAEAERVRLCIEQGIDPYEHVDPPGEPEPPAPSPSRGRGGGRSHQAEGNAHTNRAQQGRVQG
mmetsp:Transcript_34619/g.75667  ORF Transcript_34619/g.75667 Transcript_34619/m.75667 type:complete len:711 (-) Transcript_34619:222-2354(-)|eukprot:CAMPEP_0118925600 /NCGR_PEP_ID=MMETSP1169-20130426/3461_1 /TAXON_ID=36882 /ORGANISM="Pyramimonas obovata, Strain CCMP722" /LENGTH=710 /DNA_ID=CAMNT_0006866947 /DNA_START=57 /DNA_END=2189 /DNA_ORIENTATION=+